MHIRDRFYLCTIAGTPQTDGERRKAVSMASATDGAPDEVVAGAGPQDLPDSVLQEILSQLSFRERVRVLPRVRRCPPSDALFRG